MRLRLQDREFEERIKTQRAEAAMRQKKEEDDRKERREFIQMMAGIVSNLQKNELSLSACCEPHLISL